MRFLAGHYVAPNAREIIAISDLPDVVPMLQPRHHTLMNVDLLLGLAQFFLGEIVQTLFFYQGNGIGRNPVLSETKAMDFKVFRGALFTDGRPTTARFQSILIWFNVSMANSITSTVLALQNSGLVFFGYKS